MKLDELKKQGNMRAMQALEYRKQGLTYKEICEIMGVCRTRVGHLVKKAERICAKRDSNERI
jgi:DNA-directed RNA polymerase specialized sigma24 family protein